MILGQLRIWARQTTYAALAQAQTQDETHHLFLRKDTLAKDCVTQGNCFAQYMETRQGEYIDYPMIYANQKIYLGSPCPN